MSASSGTPYIFSPTDHSHLIPYLAAIHASCISQDRTLATFLPPLSHEKLLGWWKERIAEVTAGTRMMLILLDESEPGTKPKGTELMGVVMLRMPYSETGPFRGFVEKLLVSPKFRGRGGARMLMSALEGESIRRGRTLLMLDTEAGSVAEMMYRKFGYVEVGRIPNYGISPAVPRQLKDEVFFYKHLQT
ncbi:Acetyltransferase [Colletotrichum musicola]|uniref:Acetyltransferase n=3 Tax=Colletotrichum orchidearum species complex TaxID=2707337 RepID=A0A8H6U6C1_9PEZI|nr:Acetyltransferase [Colletotrichum sojae]KAF6840910.1 Acetyltransferase [Colletotrichum plurivorum]KAF6842263.1 Acetyltransferase [Colletotrichum musicola]